jgi:hypothetical protein
MNKEELINTICAIIGSKKFEFSEAYIKNSGMPTIGKSERPYYSVTKKYVYVECFAVYKYDEDTEEYGYDIRKLPICYNRYDGIFAHKLALADLFTSDLEKILKDIQNFLWWETGIHKLQIKAELEKCESYEKAYQKMVKLIGEPD